MTDQPRRIQLRRTRGWRMPPGAVKVDRTTRWGNPFVGDDYPTRAAQAARFSASLLRPPAPAPDSYMGRILRDVAELAGKDLACWCPLDGPCHADVLLALANGRAVGQSGPADPTGQTRNEP